MPTALSAGLLSGTTTALTGSAPVQHGFDVANDVLNGRNVMHGVVSRGAASAGESLSALEGLRSGVMNPALKARALRTGRNAAIAAGVFGGGAALMNAADYHLAKVLTGDRRGWLERAWSGVSR